LHRVAADSESADAKIRGEISKAELDDFTAVLVLPTMTCHMSLKLKPFVMGWYYSPTAQPVE
jgi:hypothetical protein